MPDDGKFKEEGKGIKIFKVTPLSKCERALASRSLNRCQCVVLKEHLAVEKEIAFEACIHPKASFSCYLHPGNKLS